MFRGSRHLSANEWGAKPETDWRKKVWLFVQRAEVSYRCMSTLNMLVFLFQGQYRHVGERVLAIRMLPKEPNLMRNLNFDYMNQVLAWQAFQDLLQTLRPLVAGNAARVKSVLVALWTKFRPSRSLRNDEVPEVLPLTTCGICMAAPANSPHTGECGHVACYFCLRSALISNPEGVQCTRCGAYVTKCIRSRPDELQAAGEEISEDAAP
mmetsp:Transcript_7660/g.12159  ORF Transcript_7660/g.12159 Transcript_7660/m.12159 type:complete len:209 (+) Transcript_7660:62-688(+)